MSVAGRKLSTETWRSILSVQARQSVQGVSAGDFLARRSISLSEA